MSLSTAWDLPVVGYLRDTQNYIHLAARGLTVFDVAPSRVEKDLQQWQPICRLAGLLIARHASRCLSPARHLGQPSSG